MPCRSPSRYRSRIKEKRCTTLNIRPNDFVKIQLGEIARMEGITFQEASELVLDRYVEKAKKDLEKAKK